jgi:hypothetical protein
MMNTQSDDNAFPTNSKSSSELIAKTKSNNGMSKREYMASHIMGGLLNNLDAPRNYTQDDVLKTAADLSVRGADFLIERLNNKEK